MDDSHGHLTLEFVEQDYGRCLARVTDPNGDVLREQVYKNRNSAQASMRTWLKSQGVDMASLRRHDPETEDEGSTFEPEALPVSLADQWLTKLRQEAQDALDEAVALRLKADVLETDHKRLTAAADALEGPEG